MKRLDKDMHNIRLLESHRDLLREGLKSGGGTVLRQWDDHLPNFWHETLVLRIVREIDDLVDRYDCWSDAFLLRPGLDRIKVFVPHDLSDANVTSFVQINSFDPIDPNEWYDLHVHGYDQPGAEQDVSPARLGSGVATNQAIDLTDWLAGFNFRWCRFNWAFTTGHATLMGLEIPVDMRGTHI